MHRVAQFVAHIRARVDPAEEALVRNVLPERAQALWGAMAVADRRHALDVTEKLLAAGYDDPDLLCAALLHDVAKGRRMRLWHRVAGVLLESFAPALLVRLAAADVRSWRHGFHLYLHHERMSAELAVDGGCTSRAAGFIVGEGTEADAPLLRALKAADDAS